MEHQLHLLRLRRFVWMIARGTVWAFEQAFIFNGAMRHQQFGIARTALQHVIPLRQNAAENTYHEFMRTSADNDWEGGGNKV